MTSVSSTFPRLVCCTRIDPRYEQSNHEYFDVKFWPYPLPGSQCIFAVAGNREVFVARTLDADKSMPFEIVYWWHDIQKESTARNKTPAAASVNSVAWMKQPGTGRPLLCIAGVNPRHIVIIDITQGHVVRNLIGHGSSINELVVSPSSPNILASCSEDFTVRLWNLEPLYVSQPCVAIIAGQGHRQPLLSCTFHPTGRWLLSGSLDTAIALWAVPTSEQLDRRNNRDNEPLSVLCPHFFSTEVHHNYVDSIACYGDLIISRSAQSQTQDESPHEILLWKIDGFRGDMIVPEDIDLPEPGKETRSAFPHEKHSQGFQRLLSFSMPRSDRFYLRFGLFHQPGLRPILCMGDVKNNFSFWDLQKLESEHILPGLTSTEKLKKRKANDEDDGGSMAGVSVLEDPFKRVRPHYSFNVNTAMLSDPFQFASYKTAWSPDGHWAIAVGDQSMMVVMHRSTVV